MLKADSILKATAGALLLALTAACTTTGPVATGSTGSGRTLAFEQIDGPPQSVFKGLVSELDGQAKAHGIEIVAPGGAAHYRVRGYLANHVVSGRAQIAYVWDVYDAEERRSMRISGEEPGAKTPRHADAWTAADPVVVKKIAETSVTRLAGFLGLPAQTAPVARPVPAAAPSTPAVAPAVRPEPAPPAQQPESTDSDIPVAAAPAPARPGLFTALFAPPPAAEEPAATEEAASVTMPSTIPLPRRKPDRTAAIAGGFAVAGR